MNKANDAFKITFKGIIYKTLILFINCLFKIGMYPLVIANAFNIVYVTYNQYKVVRKNLN